MKSLILPVLAAQCNAVSPNESEALTVTPKEVSAKYSSITSSSPFFAALMKRCMLNFTSSSSIMVGGNSAMGGWWLHGAVAQCGSEVRDTLCTVLLFPTMQAITKSLQVNRITITCPTRLIVTNFPGHHQQIRTFCTNNRNNLVFWNNTTNILFKHSLSPFKNGYARYYNNSRDVIQTSTSSNNQHITVAKKMVEAAAKTTYTAAGFIFIAVAAIVLYSLSYLIINPYIPTPNVIYLNLLICLFFFFSLLVEQVRIVCLLSVLPA